MTGKEAAKPRLMLCQVVRDGRHLGFVIQSADVLNLSPYKKKGKSRAGISIRVLAIHSLYADGTAITSLVYKARNMRKQLQWQKI